MKTINNIVVFDNDKYFLAVLKGYCYANHIAMTEVDFNVDGINELEKIKPDLIVVSLDLISTADKSHETRLLRRAGSSGQVKICGLNKNSTDIISAGLSGWIDVIINNPFDIGEFDGYIKETFLLNSFLTEKSRERRSFTDRRGIGFNNNGADGYKETRNPGVKNFQIDQSNKCVSYLPEMLYLTPRQLEVLEHIKLGEPNKIIAYNLGMKECTVKVHVRDIMKKLKATNRTQLVYKAGLIKPELELNQPSQLSI